MEAKEKQFIITQEWLEEMGAYEAWFRVFKKHFPNGGEALEVLKRCGELCYFGFGEWLVDHLPPIYPPLERNISKHYNFSCPGIERLKDFRIKGNISLFKNLSPSKGEIDEKTDSIKVINFISNLCIEREY